MIVVTGATGQLGRGVVDGLLERLPSEQIGVSVRDPDQASDLADRGVRVRRGDYADETSLLDAFEGAHQVLVVSTNSMDPEVVERHHHTAINAAVAAGARRILYTSHAAASAASPFPPARDHAAAEAMLAASGVAWTSLRNGFYTSSLAFMVGDAASSGTVTLPADGPVAWTAPADLAEAAAAVLVDEGRFDGPTPPLTGSSALTFDDVADVLAGLVGRPVHRTVTSDESYVEAMTAHGLPPMLAEGMLGVFLAARAGQFATVDPTLATLLGREPTTVRESLQATLASA